MPLRGRATGRTWGAACGIRTPRQWAVGGRRAQGAGCPLMRWVPGARGDISGDRQCPDPVGQRTATPPRPPPLPRSVSPMRMEATRAPRKKPPRRAPPALPPHWAAVNLPAAGIDGGADAHAVAVPPSDDPPPGRRVGASTVA